MLEEPEDDIARWRVKWAGGVALLRAVGHVLLYEDAADDPKLKERVDEQFSRWKASKDVHAIYWKFIRIERDGLLKHYRSGAYVEENIALGVEQDGVVEMHVIDGDLYRPFEGSYRPGDDARDIFEEALEWWAREIDQIEGLTA